MYRVQITGVPCAARVGTLSKGGEGNGQEEGGEEECRYVGYSGYVKWGKGNEVEEQVEEEENCAH